MKIQRIGGVEFIIYKILVSEVTEIASVCSRVLYILLRLNSKYSIEVVQVYAPINNHIVEEVDDFYGDINGALHKEPANYTRLIGDFNAKLGHKQDDTAAQIGKHGYKIQEQDLCVMNSFFDNKKKQQKWTWLSSDGNTKNEIDLLSEIRKKYSVISTY